jgi:hypothetical protein
MIKDREKQGPGRAYWFDTVEEAKEFAEKKQAKGHIVTTDFANNTYVWVSNSWKKHSYAARLVEIGYDTLAV